MSILDQLVSKAGRLYSLPGVAMRVLELTDDPQVDTRALKECIENDPALTTKILRVVNSSLFGLSREVSDLNQALALLGTKPLKLLVLGFSLPAGFFVGLTADMLGRYWRHTLTKAVAAREISETVCHRPGDESFIAGLLQDLGMLLLIQDLGPPYVEFLEKVRQRGADLPTLETESLGFDHTLLSSRLLEHWKLPETLVEAVRRDVAAETPAPESRAQPSLAQILGLAEQIAQWLADGQANALERLLSAQQHHGLPPKQLEDIVATLEEKVRQLADVLSLNLPQGRDYRDLLTQAHERLSEAAADAASELLRHRGFQVPGVEDQSLLDHVRSLSEAAGQMSRRGTRPPPPARGDHVSTEGVAGEPSPVAPASDALPAAAPRSGAAAVAEADPGLLGHLAATVIACRQARCAISLLLVELNDVDELVLTRGLEGFAKLRRVLGTTCRSLDHPRQVCLPHGDAGFALIFPDCDRSQAVHLGNLVIDRVRRLTSIGHREPRPPLGVSVGVATVSLPPKNFPADELFAAADRCLYGSRSSGGGVVKSIEIY